MNPCNCILKLNGPSTFSPFPHLFLSFFFFGGGRGGGGGEVHVAWLVPFSFLPLSRSLYSPRNDADPEMIPNSETIPTPK